MRLPDPKGSLSQRIPPSAIALANQEIRQIVAHNKVARDHILSISEVLHDAIVTIRGDGASITSDCGYSIPVDCISGLSYT